MTPLETLELQLSSTKTFDQIKAIKAKNYKKSGAPYSLAGVPTYIRQLALRYRARGLTVPKSVARAVEEAREDARKGNAVADEAVKKYDEKWKRHSAPGSKYANINKPAKAEFKGLPPLANYRRNSRLQKKRNEKK